MFDYKKNKCYNFSSKIIGGIKMKKCLLMGFAVMACLVVLCGCGKKTTKNNDNKKETYEKGPFALTNGKLEDRVIAEGVKLSNTNFSTVEGKTTFSTDISNTSNAEIKIYELHIIIKNTEGQEMTKFKTRIDNLGKGETKSVSTSMDFKLDGFKTVEYELIKEA